MNRETALLFGLVLTVGILLFTSSFLTSYGKSKEEKAIDKALNKVGYKNVCKLGVTTKTNNQTQQIYNNSKCVIVVPPLHPPNPPT